MTKQNFYTAKLLQFRLHQVSTDNLMNEHIIKNSYITFSFAYET
jgi:hypothetical protein